MVTDCVVDMSDAPTSLRFENYAGSLSRARVRCARPTSWAALQDFVIRHDPATHGQVTLRSTGNSLHNQSLGPGTMLLLDRMPHSIKVTVDDDLAWGSPVQRWPTAEVTGWTPWDAIVRATLGLTPPDQWVTQAHRDVWRVTTFVDADPSAEGNVAIVRSHTGMPTRPRLLPYSLVSSGRISAAGSLSADAVWRCASALGRESDSVVWFDLLTSDGTVLRIFDPRHEGWQHRVTAADRQFAPTAEANARAFDAVVGGFGLLGVLVRIKYRLLELPPDAPRPHGVDPHIRDPSGPWPLFPHTGPAQFGSVGAGLGVQALTWIRAASSTDAILDALVEHYVHAAQQRIASADDLPRKAGADLVGRLGMVFPNRRRRLLAVLGDIRWGEPPPGTPRFEPWDRGYSWRSTSLILRFGALPWFARIGEWLAYRRVFQRAIAQAPMANPIPEFAFFLEGHTHALAQRRKKPRTLQQAWAIPIELDDRGRCVAGRELLSEFIAELRRLGQGRFWRSNAVRVQLCDLKLVPPGRGVLSCARNTLAVVVTATVENVRGYRTWPGGQAAPRRAFRELTATFAPRGVKLFLAKALEVSPEDLARMYGVALEEFMATRRTLDPRGCWSSDFLTTLRS